MKTKQKVLYKNDYISIVYNGEYGYYPILDTEGNFITNIYNETNVNKYLKQFEKVGNDLDKLLDLLGNFETFTVLSDKPNSDEPLDYINKIGDVYIEIME